MQQSNNDKSRIILTADKGVVMNNQDNLEKAKNLLEQPVYRPLLSDPTIRYKAKLINIPKRIKRGSGMDDNDSIYNRMYLTEAISPKLYGLARIHKKDNPLGP